MNRWTNEPSNKWANRLTEWQANEPTNQRTDEPMNQPTNEPTNRPTKLHRVLLKESLLLAFTRKLTSWNTLNLFYLFSAIRNVFCCLLFSWLTLFYIAILYFNFFLPSLFLFIIWFLFFFFLLPLKCVHPPVCHIRKNCDLVHAAGSFWGTSF